MYNNENEKDYETNDQLSHLWLFLILMVLCGIFYVNFLNYNETKAIHSYIKAYSQGARFSEPNVEILFED